MFVALRIINEIQRIVCDVHPQKPGAGDQGSRFSHQPLKGDAIQVQKQHDFYHNTHLDAVLHPYIFVGIN